MRFGRQQAQHHAELKSVYKIAISFNLLLICSRKLARIRKRLEGASDIKIFENREPQTASDKHLKRARNLRVKGFDRSVDRSVELHLCFVFNKSSMGGGNLGCEGTLAAGLNNAEGSLGLDRG